MSAVDYTKYPQPAWARHRAIDEEWMGGSGAVVTNTRTFEHDFIEIIMIDQYFVETEGTSGSRDPEVEHVEDVIIRWGDGDAEISIEMGDLNTVIAALLRVRGIYLNGGEPARVAAELEDLEVA